MSAPPVPPGEIHVVIPHDPPLEQLSALASALLARRERILERWRAVGDAGPDRSIAASLSRAQFNDHIPAVLDCFAHTVQEVPGVHDPIADAIQTQRVCEHGMQRWQQGYQLRELIREWGHLQMCVNEELEEYAANHPTLDPRVMPRARRAWAQLCADGVTESATQYWRLHQTESAGHVSDLENALTTLRDLERARAETWRSAAHDLRGSVTVVKGATSMLNQSDSDPDRAEITDILGKSVASLHDMLGDLLSLARLEAGHEQRELEPFDAAVVLRDFCTASQATATDRGLFLKMDGPSSLPVVGDRSKVVRILQNLLLNAVKYTERGGVSVTWGLDKNRETDRWTFSVQDSGPGIDEAEAAPLAEKIRVATEVAQEAIDAGEPHADMAQPKTMVSQSSAAPSGQQPGEGVGLSIVKRLCELLDASLELATSPGYGSTFRVVLPRSYPDAT